LCRRSQNICNISKGFIGYLYIMMMACSLVMRDERILSFREISGSHGGEYENDVFWDVEPCSQGALIMEAVGTSGTSINFCHTTRRSTPEDNHRHVVSFLCV
jgi:hypothetical protein